ncbi:TPA: TonB-dependent receptor [Elizabethkingia anophelis]|uniref:TonB-dependent receptor plug domain-containing protein n=1 Tax=Elizabethkingia anophelis TaxID=1117645 RepID=UPI00162AD6B2|nr:TonB-dependent receptor [Elizabethkingia anophelis]MCT3674057.1 TonB-dependent receptor [Elizabethkingia anophelis]MCT3681542.1 TonB-dependent receptor [Elizabethkingia anophelis]MCT3701839.1 TonB-dependent receptor [Elizabethkingia anophelis]MCT3771045.1 TonB-dependent receptor [Elizabethkingia anophelis]MCT3781333.1 TonB-dependent receptor [Elizabethkingia anophelis]
MKKLLLSAIVLIPAAGIMAQEKAIDEVVIDGKFLSLPYKKVSENIEIITKEQIEKAPAQSIEDLLAYYTGVDVRRRGMADTQADVSIRGSSFEQVLMLVNGIRMSDAQTGHNMMNVPFSLASVERIEIIKGPAARRFGQNAYAGVINIITKASGKDEYRVSAIGGDYKTWSLGAAADFGNEKFGNFLQVNNTESAGYRYNTDYKIKNFWYQNQMKIKDGSIKFQAGFVEKKFGANGFYSSPAAKDQYEETQTSLVSAIYNQKFGNWGVNANLYWRRAQDMYLFVRNKPEIYRNMHIGNNYGGELNLSYKSSLGVTGIGAEMHQEDLRSNNLGARGRFVTQILAEHHFSFINNRLSIIPGASWVNYTGTGNFFYPGVDVGFDIDKQNKIYGNVAKVHRVPTYTDLYYQSKTEQGNADLKPENALSYEIGYRFSRQKFLFKTSVFGRDSKNAIDWTRANANSIWVAENISDVKTKGLEVEASQGFNSFIKNISIGYTYLDSKAKNNDKGENSRYALENLKHQFNAKLTLGYWKFTNELIYQYNQRVTLGSYNLLDEKLTFSTKDVDIFLLINNITNAKYTGASLVPMPGRWFQLGFNFKGKF